ncbi:MAG: radical SAM protein [Candidatus Sumerlaeota bacterium]|nr:radical SAM protein [Candidatus Sumerlaeota bacterium]
MKVLLIHPPGDHMLRTNVPSVVDEETGCYPPLGLMYVAAWAEAQGRRQISILDAYAEKLAQAQIEERIRRAQPDVVGIQTLTFTLIDAIATARSAKRAAPKAHVCLGGPHVYLFPQETLSIPEVDSLVLGEGEMIFSELLDALEKGADLSGISGVVFRRDDGAIVDGGRRPLIENLDVLPPPARHLLDIQCYHTLLARSSPITTMMTSRGCPCRCIFCDRPHLGKRFRARSAASVVAEMKQIQEMGIREIFIYDDTFSISRQRVVEICDLIQKEGVKIGWDMRARINTVDAELLKRLRAAGCLRIHYGVESGVPEVLKRLRKEIDLEQARAIFKETKKVGIQTLAYFILGNPGETRAQMQATIDYARSIHADFTHWAVMTPFPGTELYTMGLDSGILPNDYWREFARNPTPDFVPMVWEETLKREELIAMLYKAYRAFYYRPGYLVRRIFEVRSWEEFRRKARAALRMFTATGRK